LPASSCMPASVPAGSPQPDIGTSEGAVAVHPNGSHAASQGLPALAPAPWRPLASSACARSVCCRASREARPRSGSETIFDDALDGLPDRTQAHVLAGTGHLAFANSSSPSLIYVETRWPLSGIRRCKARWRYKIAHQ
jgi:hypothetical protein